MPKRRVRSAKQIAAQRKASLASAIARKSKGRSTSNPIPAGKAVRGNPWPHAQKGSFGSVRRHKLGGKSYQKKSGSGFKPAAEANAILAGTTGFRDRATSDRESNAAMYPLQEAMGHPVGAKVPKPPKSALKGKRVAKGTTPSQMHGSGTGLSSAYRYLPANVAKRKRKAS